MGLSVVLSNALSGMRVGQKALDVVSSNVANAGTPGYHRRSVSVIDTLGVNSSYAREGALSRVFNQSLQQHLQHGGGRIRLLQRPGDLPRPAAEPLRQARYARLARQRLQRFPNRAGDGGHEPRDSYANRAELVQKAQTLAGTLNRLTGDVQSLRQEIETQLGNNVDTLNTQLESLEQINTRLGRPGHRPRLARHADRPARPAGGNLSQADSTCGSTTARTIPSG